MTRVEKLLLLLLPLPFGLGFLAPGPVTEPLESETVFAFTDPEIVESSGLVARGGLVVTVNDSGDGNRIFTVDPVTGGTVGTTRWQGDARDIEALAPAGAGRVYVGDIGDNMGSRERIQVARVPAGLGEREVSAETYDLAYADGPHDAEALLVHPTTGRLYVVSKEFIGRIYAAPERLDAEGTGELTPVDEVLGIVTDGAFLPDGEHLVLRNYTQAAVYTWPELDRVALLDLPPQQQGEGLAVTEDGEILLSSEGQDAEVLRVELPADLRAELDGNGTVDEESGAPSPEAGSDGGESSPVEVAEERSWWPWALGGVVGVVGVVVTVLVRSLRPR